MSLRILSFVVCCLVPFLSRADLSVDDFVSPPASARPHTWYHLMNGNVTKEGVTRDFEALAEAGFGGVQMFDAGCDIPPGGLDFNSPEWFDLLRHAASEARRLGLEVCIPNCSGWSSSGGPWNPPSNGMKRVVFSETRVKGPMRFRGVLPREKRDNGFYEDISILAFPTPPAEMVTFPSVTTTVDQASFEFTSRESFCIRGFSYRLDIPWLWNGDAKVRVESLDETGDFREIDSFDIALARSGVKNLTLRYHGFTSTVTTRTLRVSIDDSLFKIRVKEARPEARLSLSDLEAKTFGVRQDTSPDKTVATVDQIVAVKSVMDVGDKMSGDGLFEWDVPVGEWTILRIGYICNGRKNSPASEHGSGLEVDKLSSAAMDYHFEQYVGRLCRTLGPLAGKVESGLNNILVDSYEVGSQNWTKGLEREFAMRRGYDLRVYLPVFAGHIVGSVEESERFLEDFRRVVADLFAENYAGALSTKCRQYGLQFSLEPYGSCPADNLQYGQYADIPMGEFWSHAAYPYSPSDGNAKFASYIAHVWGKRICATESFTAVPEARRGRWLTTPFCIKAQGDLAYSDGVNRLIYHRFVHQPWADDKYLPGMTMGMFGMHLDRTQTWWPLAKPFFRYQARCQYMLQRGTFVADALFFAGEEAPNLGGDTDGAGKPGSFSFRLPEGYDSDICSIKALSALKIDNGEIVVPGGVRYRMLVVPPAEAMSPKTVGEIARLQREGAKVVWPAKPVRALGLSGGKDADSVVRRLADGVFAAGALAMTPERALAALGIDPQVSWGKGDLPSDVKRINWIHRQDGSVEWFFVALPTKRPVSMDLSFRVNGKVPELWDAESGRIERPAAWREKDGRTIVRVPFDVCGSKFVVFNPASKRRRAEPLAVVVDVSSPVTVDGPWEVSFPGGFLPNALATGTVEKVSFDRLEPWNERQEEGIRYFSGRAVYRKQVKVPLLEKENRLVLDLGQVCELAEVRVNGKRFDALWHPPFRVDVTSALVAGSATFDLEICVANLWANRLIGDDRLYAPDCEWKGGKNSGIKEIPQWVKEGKPSPTGRHTFTTWKHWSKEDKLLPSGLIGPVRLHVAVEKKEKELSL